VQRIARDLPLLSVPEVTLHRTEDKGLKGGNMQDAVGEAVLLPVPVSLLTSAVNYLEKHTSTSQVLSYLLDTAPSRLHSKIIASECLSILGTRCGPSRSCWFVYHEESSTDCQKSVPMRHCFIETSGKQTRAAVWWDFKRDCRMKRAPLSNC
jgi:hypothetical protein